MAERTIVRRRQPCWRNALLVLLAASPTATAWVPPPSSVLSPPKTQLSVQNTWQDETEAPPQQQPPQDNVWTNMARGIIALNRDMDTVEKIFLRSRTNYLEQESPLARKLLPPTRALKPQNSNRRSSSWMPTVRPIPRTPRPPATRPPQKARVSPPVRDSRVEELPALPYFATVTPESVTTPLTTPSPPTRSGRTPPAVSEDATTNTNTNTNTNSNPIVSYFKRKENNNKNNNSNNKRPVRTNRDPFGATLDQNPLSSLFNINPQPSTTTSPSTNKRTTTPTRVDNNVPPPPPPPPPAAAAAAAAADNQYTANYYDKVPAFPIPSQKDLGALLMAYQHDLQLFQEEKELLLAETERLEDEVRLLQDQMVRNTNTYNNNWDTPDTYDNNDDAPSKIQEQAATIQRLQQSQQDLLEFSFVRGSFAAQQQLEQQQLLLQQYQTNQTALLAEQSRLTQQLEHLQNYTQSQQELWESSTAEQEALREQLEAVTREVTTKLHAVEQQAQIDHDKMVALERAKQALVEYAIIDGDTSTLPGTTAVDLAQQLRTLRQERTLLTQRLATSDRMIQTVQQKLLVLQELYDKEQDQTRTLQAQVTQQRQELKSQQEQYQKDTVAWETERTGLQDRLAQLQSDQQKLHQQWAEVRTDLLREKVAVDAYRQEVERLRTIQKEFLEFQILHSDTIPSVAGGGVANCETLVGTTTTKKNSD